MSEIRTFARADVPAVAALFQKTFREPGRPATPALETCLAEAFLEHPWYDREIASRVHVGAEEKVTGFIGVFPGRFVHRGRTVRAAIAGTLMVESPEREPLAGAKLLRSVVKGPQEISISESTNLISRRLWEPLGGKVVPLLSLDWFRVMRPGAAALAMFMERIPRGALLAPGAKAIDWVGKGWTERNLRPGSAPGRLTLDSLPSDAAFAGAVGSLSEDFELRPAWSQADVEWFVSQAGHKARYGSLRRAIACNRKGETVGCYLYHGNRGGVGRVLQVLARPDAIGEVVDSLFAEADQAGLAGLRGRCTPGMMNSLLTRNCLYVHRASTVFHTGDPELARTIKSGGALITGLAGEGWTRLVGDEFG